MDNNAYQAPESDISTLDNEATQPVKIFNSSGRMGRVRFVCYSIGLPFLIIAIFGLLAAMLGGFEENSSIGAIILVVGLIVYLGAIVVSFIAGIQRCHDINISGWFILLNLIVPFSLVLMFIPGTKGENKYGFKPEPNKPIHWIGAIVVPILLIGILAAVAIPAYQDYVERAQASQMQDYNG